MPTSNIGLQLDKIREDIHDHMDTLGQVTEEQQLHELDSENPHVDSPTSVGLGDLANYPVATPEEAALGESADRYLTPSLADDVWGDHAIEPTINTQIRKPVIAYPVQNATDVDRSPTIVVSGYASNPVTGFPMTSREYQIDAAGNDFSNPIWTHTASDQSPVTVDITLSYHALLVCRVRDIDTEGNVSDWSVSHMFRTVAYETVPANITSPADGGSAAIGDSVLWTAYGASDFEGYYTLDHYAIEIADDSGFTNILLSDTTAAPSYEIGSDLPSEVTIWVRVRPVWVEDVTTAWSSAVEMTVDAYELLPLKILTPSEGSVLVMGDSLITWEDYTVSDPEGLYTFKEYKLSFSQPGWVGETYSDVTSKVTPTYRTGTVLARVRVEWVEGGVVSPWSDQMEFTVVEPPYWIKGLGGSGLDRCLSVVALSDDRVISVGDQASDSRGDTDALITKNSGFGNREWSYSLGISGGDTRYNGVTRLANDDVIAVGHHNAPGSGSDSAFISRWTEQGTHVWSRTLGGPRKDLYTAVTTLPGGDIVAVGQQASDAVAANSALISRWSADGTHLWSRSIRNQGYDTYYGVATLPNGDLVAVGRIYRYRSVKWDYYPLISRWNKDGAHLWSRELNDRGAEYRDITIAEMGRVVAVGFGGEGGSGGKDAVISKWSSEGTLLWSRSLGGSGDDYYYSVSTLPDYSVVAVGYQASDTQGNHDAFISRWSQNGTHLWSRSLGGNNVDLLYGVTTLSTGKIVACGHQASFTFGSYDSLLVSVSMDSSDHPNTGPLPDVTTLHWGVPSFSPRTTNLGDGTYTLTVSTPPLTVSTPTLDKTSPDLSTYVIA